MAEAGKRENGEYRALASGEAQAIGELAPASSWWHKLKAYWTGLQVRPAGRWNPEEAAGPLATLTFGWVGSLISMGNKKTLEVEDLWCVAKVDRGEAIMTTIETEWARELRKNKPLLALALWRCVGLRFALAGCLKLVHDCLQLSSPIFLRLIVQHLQNASAPLLPGLAFVLALLTCNLAQTLFIHRYFHLTYRCALHVRASMISLLYAKALRISATARQKTSVGQIVNLMSNDAEKLANLCIYLHIIWSGPFQILAALAMLFGVVGVIPTLGGFAVMFSLGPLSAYVVRFLTAVRKRLVVCTDRRVKLLSEVLNGIKAIKLYAWEEAFKERIGGLRDAELREIRTATCYACLQSFIISLNSVLVSIISFAFYTFLGHTLDASTAFPALALFNLLQFPLAVLPRQIESFIQARVSFTRLEAFLALDETLPPESASGQPLGSLQIRGNAAFSWHAEGGEGEATEEASKGSSARPDTLRDINLTVMPGQLLMIVGEVGAGKSSLLAAMLGEIRKSSGQVLINGSVAYTAQDAWIQNATLKDNILMGRPLDPERYERVLEACALKEDLRTLPGGDGVEIGEKGINLSGGQKQRVALARAVYGDADIFLLDDPLSAVDSHVGRHLMDSAILGELAGRTRVLVTHQLQYGEAADAIAVLKNGTIQLYGSYLELKACGYDFSAFLQANAGEESSGSASVSSTERSTNSSISTPPITRAPLPATPLPAAAQIAETTPLLARAEKGAVKGDEAKTNGNGSSEKGKVAEVSASGTSGIIQKEFRAKGKVRISIYMAYFRAWGPGLWLPLLALALYTLTQATKLGTDAWLAIWTSKSRSSDSSVYFYLGVYCGLTVLGALFLLARNLHVRLSCVGAARNLHRQLLERTLQLPMAFFESQPVGRLLNRFARDTEQVDVTLGDTVNVFVSCVFQIVAAISIIIFVTPFSAFAIFPILLLYNAVQRFYIAASRELKRVDSLMRSPLFAHLSESVAGLTTIRAFRRQSAFLKENLDRLDQSSRAYFASQTSNRWLGVRLESMGALLVFATGFFCVWMHDASAGFAALALTNALLITSYMNWLVRNNADLETQMNSAERLLEYSELPTEAPRVIASKRAPTAWPDRGTIDVDGIVVRYRPDLDPVLKGLTFSILSGEKVGVCGRTGCGKSTLMLTLYRLMELERGRIAIDGIDIATIGLYDLRSKLSLVPQDPVVFSGTVRFNLDPFELTGDDSELWSALRQAGINGAVESLPDKLDSEISEGGSNLSTGQRQLLCMARALLRNSKILILDEATSNVDSATDGVIQSTIRTAFKECTVLTIAHRLHTIIDSDRVLLLEDGNLAEFESPAVLLQTKNSKFAGFVDSTLPEQAAALRGMAAEASIRRSSSSNLNY